MAGVYTKAYSRTNQAVPANSQLDGMHHEQYLKMINGETERQNAMTPIINGKKKEIAELENLRANMLGVGDNGGWAYNKSLLTKKPVGSYTYGSERISGTQTPEQEKKSSNAYAPGTGGTLPNWDTAKPVPMPGSVDQNNQWQQYTENPYELVDRRRRVIDQSDNGRNGHIGDTLDAFKPNGEGMQLLPHITDEHSGEGAQKLPYIIDEHSGEGMQLLPHIIDRDGENNGDSKMVLYSSDMPAGQNQPTTGNGKWDIYEDGAQRRRTNQPTPEPIPEQTQIPTTQPDIGGEAPGISVDEAQEWVLKQAETYFGDKYSDTDCSDLTQKTYGDLGIYIPGTANRQAEYLEKYGTVIPVEGEYIDGKFEDGEYVDGIFKLDESKLKPGDLIFYKMSDRKEGDGFEATHVVIYVGDGKIIHSRSAGEDRGPAYESIDWEMEDDEMMFSNGHKPVLIARVYPPKNLLEHWERIDGK